MLPSLAGLGAGPKNLITDVAGIAVGNAEDTGVRSGVTVVLAEAATVAGVDVRGGAPGTRETDALAPDGLAGAVDAVALSGGSVFGLDAASGVAAWLAARGRGFVLANAPLRAPIVPAAIIEDLSHGGDKDWGEEPPYRRLARVACEAAGASFGLGNAGAGLGARAGDLKGGLGSASIVTEAGVVVGALAAVNAMGSAVVPGTGVFWAAPFEIGGEFGGRTGDGSVAARHPLEGTSAMLAGAAPRGNTTIAVVVTNAELSRPETRRLAVMAQSGLARALRPAHSPVDGDVVFALAAGAAPLPEPRPLALAVLGTHAADTLARAIARGVYEAESLGGLQSYRDRFA